VLDFKRGRREIDEGHVDHDPGGKHGEKPERSSPLVTPKNSRRFLLVTDDRHPKELLEEGHINSMVKQAGRMGADPGLAIQMATLNTAEYFRLDHLGASHRVPCRPHNL